MRQTWPSIVAGICALTLSMGIGRFAYTPIIAIMEQQAGLSVLTAGWVASANYLGYFIGSIIPLILGRRISAPLLFRLGIIATIVSFACLPLSVSPWVWSFWRLISGIASAFTLIATSKIILVKLREKGAMQHSGWIFSGIGIGIVISALVVDLLAVNWQQIWWLLAIICVILSLPTWRVSEAKAPPLESVLRLSHFPVSVILITLGYSCSGFGYITSATFLPILLGSGESANTLSWLIVGLAVIPSTVLWSQIAERFGVMASLVSATLIQASSVILPVIIANELSLYLSALLFGLSFMGVVTLTLQAVSKVAGDTTSFIALCTIGYSIGQVLGPVVTNFLAEHVHLSLGAVTLGHFDLGLITAFVMTLIGALCYALSQPKLIGANTQ